MSLKKTKISKIERDRDYLERIFNFVKVYKFMQIQLLLFPAVQKLESKMNSKVLLVLVCVSILKLEGEN